MCPAVGIDEELYFLTRVNSAKKVRLDSVGAKDISVDLENPASLFEETKFDLKFEDVE
jgi:hypothetical protein